MPRRGWFIIFFFLEPLGYPKGGALACLLRDYGCGLYAGKIFCMVMALDYLIWKFLEWLFPVDTIEKARNFPYQKYNNFFLQHKQNYVMRQENIIQQVVQEVDEEESFSTQQPFFTEPSQF